MLFNDYIKRKKVRLSNLSMEDKVKIYEFVTKENYSNEKIIRTVNLITKFPNIINHLEEYFSLSVSDRTKHNEYTFELRYGKDEGQKKFNEYKKSKSQSLEQNIRRYGEVEGTKKYNDYWDKENRKFGTSKKCFENKGSSKHDEFRKIQGFNNTLEGYIKRYGEDEGTKKYIEANKKKSKSLSKKELFNRLKKEGLTDDKICSIINRRWSYGLKYHIEKYGEEDGKRIHDEIVERRMTNNPICQEYYIKRGKTSAQAKKLDLKENIFRNSLPRKNISSSVSVESFNFFNDLTMYLDCESQYGYSEYVIPYTRNKIKKCFFKYDFLCKNVIVEYNGSRYHVNPKCPGKYASKKQTPEMRILGDSEKIKTAEENGFTVIVVWDTDDKETKMKEILNEIKNS